MEAVHWTGTTPSRAILITLRTRSAKRPSRPTRFALLELTSAWNWSIGPAPRRLDPSSLREETKTPTSRADRDQHDATTARVDVRRPHGSSPLDRHHAIRLEPSSSREETKPRRAEPTKIKTTRTARVDVRVEFVHWTGTTPSRAIQTCHEAQMPTDLSRPSTMTQP